jgi:hypothetical protein
MINYIFTITFVSFLSSLEGFLPKKGYVSRRLADCDFFILGLAGILWDQVAQR